MNAKQLKFLKEILSEEDYCHLLSLSSKKTTTAEPGPSVEKVQCDAMTKKGVQCKKTGGIDGKCATHSEKPKESGLNKRVAKLAVPIGA